MQLPTQYYLLLTLILCSPLSLMAYEESDDSDTSPAHEISIPEVADFESITGLGARARVDGRVYHVGGRRLFETLAVPLGNAEADIVRLESEGKTAVLVGSKDEILGAIDVVGAVDSHVARRLAVAADDDRDRRLVGPGRVVVDLDAA